MVTTNMAKKRHWVSRVGNNAYSLRVRTPGVPESRAYTGFFAWGKKDCGIDFINKLNTGEVGIYLVDQEVSYSMVGHYMGQESQHTNVVFQFTHTPCEGTCLGNASKDMFDLLVTGIASVDFGNKDKHACITSVKNGYLGVDKNDITDVAAEDLTPCVSWTNKYW